MLATLPMPSEPIIWNVFPIIDLAIAVFEFYHINFWKFDYIYYRYLSIFGDFNISNRTFFINFGCSGCRFIFYISPSYFTTFYLVKDSMNFIRICKNAFIASIKSLIFWYSFPNTVTNSSVPTDFNTRAHEGRDSDADEIINFMKNFNPRAHEGRDCQILCYCSSPNTF